MPRSTPVSRLLPPWLVNVLATLVGVSAKAVHHAWAMLARRDGGYPWTFTLEGEKPRTVHVPSAPLRRVQEALRDRVLQAFPPSPAAFGGVPGRSAVEAAQRHLTEHRHLFIADIADAYGSVQFRQLTAVLRRQLKPMLWVLGHRDRGDRVQGASAIASLLTLPLHVGPRGLPLGSPASVAAFNLLCVPIDRDIARMLAAACSQLSDIRYTRYMDDLTISAPSRLPDELPALVDGVLQRYDLTLNARKTRRGTSSEVPVHGLIRDVDGQPGLGKDAQQRMRTTIETTRADALNLAKSAEQRRDALARLRGIDVYLRQVYAPPRQRPSALVIDWHDVAAPAPDAPSVDALFETGGRS